MLSLPLSTLIFYKLEVYVNITVIQLLPWSVINIQSPLLMPMISDYIVAEVSIALLLAFVVILKC